MKNLSGGGGTLEMVNNMQVSNQDNSLKSHIQGIDPFLRNLINADLCAENMDLKKEVAKLTERVEKQAELAKVMRGNYIKELTMLRGANEMQADKMNKALDDKSNLKRTGTKRKLTLNR